MVVMTPAEDHSGIADNLARHADFQRAQVGTLMAAGLTFVGIWVSLFATAAVMRAFAVALCTTTCVVSFACWVRLCRRGETDERDELMMAILLCACVVAAVAALGPDSALVIVLFPVVYTYNLIRNQNIGWFVYSTCALGYLFLAVWAFANGTWPAGYGFAGSFMMTVMVESVLFAGLVHARRNRQALTGALAQMADVRGRLQQRTNMLADAREQFVQAARELRVGPLTGKMLGRYRVGEVVGAGGMGEVYRAWSGEHAPAVALKVLSEAMRSNPAATKRFFREAKHSSALASPHIVKVLDSGFGDTGTAFLAMELLHGRDLAQLLQNRDRLSMPEAILLVRHVGSALDTAHAEGIVHRDIKPENVFLTHDEDTPCWKVLDFGVSKAHDSHGTLTQGALIGTPAYMSPEQVRSECVDARTDIFALGAIMYRVLTGENAFVTSDPVATLFQVLTEQPIEPVAYAVLPLDVELVLAIALAKDRTARFASAAEMADAFVAAAQSELATGWREHGRRLLAQDPWTPEVLPDTVRAVDHEVVRDDEPSFTMQYVRPVAL
jgi:hypothetical protein